jgi:hypothetical protein
VIHMYPEVFFWRRRMIHIPPTYAGVPGFPPPATEPKKSQPYVCPGGSYAPSFTIHKDTYPKYIHDFLFLAAKLLLPTPKKNPTQEISIM